VNDYIKILLIVLFFSSCSTLDKKKYDSYSSGRIYSNQNILNKNYIGMTREQIIYIFGEPIISDSFDDVYHYYLNNDDFIQNKILNLYFKDNKVLYFNIQ